MTRHGIANWNGKLISGETRKHFREPASLEVLGRVYDPSKYLTGSFVESVLPESRRDNRVVMRPDGSQVITHRVVSGLGARKSSYSRAQLALSGKNPAEALRVLQTVESPMEYGTILFTNNPSCLYPTYIKAQAYLASGQATDAATEFQKIIDHAGMVWNCSTGALAHLGLARANALQSKKAKGAVADAARVRALSQYQQFLDLWKDADPGLPIFKMAKAEYAKLV